MSNKLRFVPLLITLLSWNVFAEKISLVTTNWEPVYGKSLPENGFFSALSREAFNKSGYEMEVKFIPWSRAVETAKKGEFDGVMGAYYTEERSKSFDYSDSVYAVEEVFVKNVNADIKYSDVNDLKPYVIGGLRGGGQLEELKKQGFKIQETSNDLQSLKKVSAGRIDLVLMGRPQLNLLLKDNPALQKKLEILEPPYKSFDVFVILSKKRKSSQNNETIITKFNQSLKEMKADGSYSEILKRFGQN